MAPINRKTRPTLWENFRMTSMTDPQGELARRLALLMDLVEAETGQPVTWAKISDHLETRDIKLSRARWGYMLNGSNALVTDGRLLLALAQFFDVPVEFLINLDDDHSMPERITKQMRLLRAMRMAKVQSFAARTVGDVSPGLLDAITEYIESTADRSDHRS